MRKSLQFPILIHFVLILAIGSGMHGSVIAADHLFSVVRDGHIGDDSRRLGFINGRGELKIGFRYYYSHEFSDGMAAVLEKKGGKWGYIDETGDLVIQPQFDKAASFSNGRTKVRKDGREFFLARDGRVAFETSLFTLGFKEGLSNARAAGKWGFIDQNGKVAIAFRFQGTYPFSENMAAAVDNGLVGYIDRSGDWVIEPRFPPMENDLDQLFLSYFSEGVAVYREGSNYGYIDRAGNTVIPASFERAQPFSEGLAVVRIGGKYGFVNKSGEFAIKPRFQFGKSFANGLAPVKDGSKWGFIDSKGNPKIAPRFESAESFKHGLARVSFLGNDDHENERHGYINTDGEVVYSWKSF
ncbi:MAG: WG repeat-containing protein [Pyrinomonadaceae bacterium]